jgi:membrane-associated protein
MDLLHSLIDYILHVDRHLIELLAQYHLWIYGILFLIIFAETGFVVTPFLPGDSLLFATGALTAVDSSGTLRLPLILLLLSAAAILGNTLNYLIGRRLGLEAFSGRYRFLKQEYLQRTTTFFERHGGMAVVLSRFVPIIRTFAPFVAGVGRMNWLRYQSYNFAGGIGWVSSMTVAGYLFGNLPLVKNNFGLVTIGIIVASLLPLLWAVWRERAATGRGAGTRG